MATRYIVLIALVGLFLPAALSAQPRFLRGEVVSIGAQGEKTPDKGLVVILKETGDANTTNDHGIFRVFLKDKFTAGWKVTLAIEKIGWQIQYPLDGETRIPVDLDELVKVQLLPVGSPLFWSHDRIEKFIQDLAEQAKRPVTPEDRPEPLDLGGAIKGWAVKYGFSAQQAREEIDQWIADIKANEDDLHKLGLAAFAEKQFRKASDLFALKDWPTAAASYANVLQLYRGSPHNSPVSRPFPL